MTEQEPPPAGPTPDPNEPGITAPTEDAASYLRPPGVDDSFDEREPLDPYLPPPLTISPEERATFGRPVPGAAFAPLPGERIDPQHMQAPPVPMAFTEAFGTPPGVTDGFDPAPGTRIPPRGREPQSPWWKPNALRDPWRDPNAPFWLGSGAVFVGNRAAQLEPDQDTETDEDVIGPPEDEAPTATVIQGRFGRRALTIMAIVGLLAGGVGGGVGYWLSSNTTDTLHRNITLAKTGTPANRPTGSVADIAKRVGPAVVSISVTTSTEYAVGSGVVIDKNGYVLTNNHVVSAAANGAGNIVVTFADEATAKARIVGLDPSSDLAVLKVPSDQLTVASLGDSSQLAVGDPVIAIGSPLALQGTVTSGIVSALNRAVHITDDQSGVSIYIDAIQTDAAINHGNSGGALVDASGAVVGINSAAVLNLPGSNGQSSSVSGIGFAIPINYARDIAQQLIRTGKAVHATMGIQGKSASTADGLQQGAYLEQVLDGGPAAKAGLKAGDVVVTADGKAAPSYDDLVVIVQQHKPGDTIAVTYYRGADKRVATVTLGSD